MIGVGIGRDAVGERCCGDVLQPLLGPRINHSKNGAGRHVARAQIIFAVAGVVPPLVRASYKIDGRENLAGSSIDDVGHWAEGSPIMSRTSHHSVRARAHDHAAWHAIRHRETVDHGGTEYRPATGGS